MDWFSWLSKTGLEATLVYEYGLAMAHNELEEEDIPHFNHECLQSIGVAIAKHRLEILKLARKEARHRRKKLPRAVSRLLVAVRRTNECIKRCVRALVRREDSNSAIVVASPRRLDRRMKKSKTTRAMPKKKVLMLTNGSPDPLLLLGSRPEARPISGKEEKSDAGGDRRRSTIRKGDEEEEEEIRWDSLFQDLKPT